MHPTQAPLSAYSPASPAPNSRRRLQAGHGLCLALGLGLTSGAGAQTTQAAQRLNPTGFNPNGDNAIDGAVICNERQNFYACWAEQFGTTNFTQDVYFARSTDDGATWSLPVRIDTGDNPNQFDSDFPKIAVTTTGAVVAVWEENRDGFPLQSTSDDVYYNRSADGGVTWLPAALPLNVGSAGGNILSDIDRIWLAASGTTFHVTWEEDTLTGLGGNEELWYTRSTDAGATWSTPVILSTNAGSNDVDEPKVAADGNLVLVTYIDQADNVIVHRSTDNGATWSAGIAIESDPNGNADEAILELGSGLAVVAWTEQDPGTPGGEGVHVAVSRDGGLTWLAEETLSVRQVATVGGDADFPRIAIQSANNVVVSYSEDSVFVGSGGATGGSNNECLIAYTNNGGTSWTKDVALWPGVTSNRPNVVATDDAFVVFLEQNANGSNIAAFTYSLDSGATWSTPELVANTGPDVDEGCGPDEGYYVVMSELTNTVMATHMDRPTGNNEVYVSGFRLSINLGTNYCQANANSTGNTGAMFAEGSRFVTENDVQLIASRLPSNSFAFFLTSRTQGFIQNPGGSQGNLCLSGSIGRYVGQGQIKNSGGSGRVALDINLNAHPTPMGLVSVVAGDTWNFTAWYRDNVGGVATSNFADGLSVTFQ